MIKAGMLKQLNVCFEFFKNTTACFTEEDSGFVYAEGAMTVAAQVAHVAHTLDWFIEGAGSESGFAMNFEEMMKKAGDCQSFTEAMREYAAAHERALKWVESGEEFDFLTPLPEGPILGGEPKFIVVGAYADHTAHHRGALAVCARLLGKTPRMPYMSE